MAQAAEWVSRITAIALEMVLPGILGTWLDQRWNTGFLGLIGFALGVTLGTWHLIWMTRTPSKKDDHSSDDRPEKDNR